MTENPASDSWRAMRSVSWYHGCSGGIRALPKMLTAGRIALRRSVASTNSDIIPNTRHDSRADQDFSISSGASGTGILFLVVIFSLSFSKSRSE